MLLSNDIFTIGDHMEENLNRMERFFKYNLEVKHILHQTVPKEENLYNKEYSIEYSDKMFKAINDIEYYINVMMKDYNFSKDDVKYFEHFIKALKQELIKCGYDYYKLKSFYEICISEMNEGLVNEVGENCVGYKIFRGVPLSQAKTINEILHVVHQTVINNEAILTSLPKLQEKMNKEGFPITLYGKNSEISNKIFNAFPLELTCGFTEIVSLSNDTIIMMIRDRGHALSIEIEKSTDKYYVKYFIPKICNVDMVNSLKGVTKVTKESKYTVGLFSSTLDKLPLELIDFISKVPTDDHMVIEFNYLNEGIKHI